ncbi:hypothetical protein TL16_g08841 [Triparma laevis f. inornata]|uniref:Uncharacterized protein n=2 Tax=Triparma laevis TaxID=1534972 RepID=A0A9W7DU62_9STRA|nr:hypothetical protein TrLO_g10023 [Triparma laevis f. longispina]GMH81148.1 hypothetical protein TL16_g08841 [Triparma laevis f. inornata]
MFGSNSSSSSSSSLPSASTPFSLSNPPSHTPLPKVLLNPPQTYTTLCLLTSISSSKVSKTGKAFKELSITYPSLSSPPTLRLFGSAYSSCSNLKPGDILILKDCKIDMLNGKHSLMTFKDTGINKLGTETHLKYCSTCGWCGTGSCIKCIRKNLSKTVDTKKLPAAKMNQNTQLQQFKNEGRQMTYHSVKPVAVEVKSKGDILGALLKKKKTQQVPKGNQRIKGLINEGDKFDGSVRVPQSSKIAVERVRTGNNFKKVNPMDVLERQREVKKLIGLNKKSGLNNYASVKNVAQKTKVNRSKSEFEDMFGGDVKDLKIVKGKKSRNEGAASDLKMLRAKEKIDGLVGREERERKKKEKEVRRRHNT